MCEGVTAFVVDAVVVPEALFAAKAPSPGAPGRAPGMAPAPGPSSSATSAAVAVAAGVAMLAGLMA